MPADRLTRDERVALQVAKTLARLYFARVHGQPWLTAEQLAGYAAALATLGEAAYVRRRTAAARDAGTAS